MNPYITTFLVIHTVHLVSAIWITIPDGIDFFSRIALTLIINVAANTALLFAFCARGRVKPFALPLMWMLCIFTLAIYCFCFSSADFGSWGPMWLVIMLGYFLLAPTVTVSIITCVIFYIVQWLRNLQRGNN